MDLKYLDVDKKGEYKIRPEIIKLENKDLLNYFNIEDIKKAHNNKKQLQITDKGIYSISKPYLSQWICNIILNNIDLSKEYIKENITLTDGTAGIGGDLIYFSKYFKKINGIELNKTHFEVLKNNIKEVLNIKNVDLFHDNYCNIYKKLENDIVYLDPPWGGKNIYKKKDVMLYLGNDKIFNIINILHEIKIKYIFLKIPHNFNYYLFLHKIKYNEVRIFKNKKVWLLMIK